MLNKLKAWWEMEYLHGFQAPTHKIFNNQEKKSNSQKSDKQAQIKRHCKKQLPVILKCPDHTR